MENHISRITKKSNNMLGFLRRNLGQASEETKAQAYFTMVRPTWTTVLKSGVHTNVTRNTRLKWSIEDLHNLSQTDTETPAASPTCLTISVGSPRLAINRSICILTRPVVNTGFNRSLLVDWWSIGQMKKT